MKGICSTESSGAQLAATFAAILDSQGNFCGTSGCSFMTVNMSMAVRPKKLDPRTTSAVTKAAELTCKNFKVVISLPKGSEYVTIPDGINSLQLSAKSRTNRQRSAASLYQFVHILTDVILRKHPSKNQTKAVDGRTTLEDQIVRKIAGEFYPKIAEYEATLTEKEQDDMLDLKRVFKISEPAHILNSELESFLTFPPNSKEAKERDSKIAIPEDMAVDPSGLPSTADTPGGSLGTENTGDEKFRRMANTVLEMLKSPTMRKKISP
ncbi:hypothetical protein GNI_181050 [Gregarina niphandrodes]|uniref:Uncharacterized protein n=1 Tax=Gregarina niphandrodes TaxID=110365 RepID=A0A023AXL5_GRENI|nr:hypothetical protein GNI_181050 [Gregarina niphandrodes]EZG43233.1 hypothetical protein GNI_181050 [Gregarina niphandrodes]|eukprot:XP_011133511.1 hypothetical protein GNI_181050 [Gregarina niphandrodes]